MNKNIQTTIGRILLIGTCISMGITFLGGFFYLIQHGDQMISPALLQSSTYHLSVLKIWETNNFLSSLTIIELGLIALVLTQILRVATLTWFYLKSNDYIFTGISFFILLILVYSLLWR